MNNDDSVFDQMTVLRELGVMLSIDDFGTGYSSLSRLKQLPIDKLKIDRSFVRDIFINANSAVIASTVVAMGRKLNMIVIAEGVETLEQLRFLSAEGCPQAQGYLYGRPMPAADFERYLNSRGRRSGSEGTIVQLFPAG